MPPAAPALGARRLSMGAFLPVPEIIWLTFNASSNSVFIKTSNPNFL